MILNFLEAGEGVGWYISLKVGGVNISVVCRRGLVAHSIGI